MKTILYIFLFGINGMEVDSSVYDSLEACESARGEIEQAFADGNKGLPLPSKASIRTLCLKTAIEDD